MELLTGPSLLILDEPTSGLDPALDRQVMTMLRELADAGRVVVVVTHSLTYLSCAIRCCCWRLAARRPIAARLPVSVRRWAVQTGRRSSPM